MTQRLYHRDAYLREFNAEVTAAIPAARASDGPAITLTETAFYPTSGGQPCDSGRLNGAGVRDVREEAGQIWHVLDPGAALPAVGDHVRGVIDWDRRFDHMQQHTGQHVLSAAFLRTLDAPTVAVHMGATCTLDLSAGMPNDDDVARVEDLANTVVTENRAVTIREVDPEEVEALGLRRLPKRTGRIRVVDVAEFDRSACGGTHVSATGEIGQIVVRGWERHKGGIRVEFLCGWRALRDGRRIRAVVRGLAAQFSVGEPDLTETVTRLRDHARDVDRDLADARTRLLAHEAGELVAAVGADRAGPRSAGSPKIVAAAFAGRSIDDLRALARLVTAQTDSLAIFATDPDRRILIARSPGVAVDAAALLRETLAPFGGRGGGKPEAAEGMAAAAPSASALVEAARLAASRASS
ncbi:MAG: alanyl-tRNA editing protein [Armatimonadota bacterium]